jgi:hypothetical protein
MNRFLRTYFHSIPLEPGTPVLLGDTKLTILLYSFWSDPVLSCPAEVVLQPDENGRITHYDVAAEVRTITSGCTVRFAGAFTTDARGPVGSGSVVNTAAPARPWPTGKKGRTKDRQPMYTIELVRIIKID